MAPAVWTLFVVTIATTPNAVYGAIHRRSPSKAPPWKGEVPNSNPAGQPS
jgi:hypothetical protein